MENSKPTILMVEDNENVLSLNLMLLEQSGKKVLAGRSLAEARALLAGHAFDLVLLDIVLPDGSGLDLIPEVRAAGDAMILLLTSRRQYQDILNGLTGGADDYMTKPYRADELQARVEALLFKRSARASRESGQYIVHGPLTLDIVNARAFLNGVNMQLTPKEYTLLLVMTQNARKTFTSEQLYKQAWRQPMEGDTNTLYVYISRLRGKLAGSGASIESARGEGYFFQLVDNFEKNRIN